MKKPVTALYKKPKIQRPSIAIIGGGATGVLTAVELHRHARGPLDIHIIEQKPNCGLGAAYSTTEMAHLLNVPAAKMSAFSDQPNHLVEWLKQQPIEDYDLDPETELGDQFIPRLLYGQYLQNILQQHLALSEVGAKIHCHQERVIALQDKELGWRIPCQSGESFTADQVILTMGNFQPNTPLRDLDQPEFSGCYYQNPWQQLNWDDIDANEDIIIIGTGLTMVDLAVSLNAHEHKGHITAISRRGMHPLSHKAHDACESPFTRETLPTTVRAAVKAFRQALSQNQDNWRGSIDSLRPLTQAIWQQWSVQEKQRFLRLVRPVWDIHRHRIAAQIHQTISTMQQSGQLTILAGRLSQASYDEAAGEATLHYRPRGQHHQEALKAKRILNATGPSGNLRKIDDPFIQNLLIQGLITPDQCHLGFTVNPDFSVQTHPRAQHKLHAIGPMVKATFWECIAIPDIRVQTKKLAEQLALKVTRPQPTTQH